MADVNEPLHALRDVARQITGGKSTTTVGATAQAPGGTDSNGNQVTVDKYVNEAAGNSDDSSHSSYESSTAGRQAQSTDHMNQY